MTFNWEVRWFDDLSGCWMQAEAPGVELCISNHGVRYKLSIHFGDSEDPDIEWVADSIEEAQEVAEAIVQQHWCDAYSMLLTFLDVVVSDAVL